MSKPPLPHSYLGQCVSAGRMTTTDGHQFEREPGFKYWTLGGALVGNRFGGPPGGEVWLRDAETFALTEPNTPYVSGHEKGRVESLWAIFEPGPGMYPYLKWPARAAGMRALRVEDAGLRRLALDALEMVIDAMQAAHANKDALAAHALMRFFLLLGPFSGREGEAQRRDPRVAAVVEAIHVAPARAWTVAELAKTAHMSESSLAHRFREEMGVSPLKYAQERRMARAKEMLLMSNEPVGEIARALGFANAFHFSTRFRAMTGKSPRAYRMMP